MLFNQGRWTILGEASAIKRSDARNAVLKALAEATVHVTVLREIIVHVTDLYCLLGSLTHMVKACLRASYFKAFSPISRW